MAVELAWKLGTTLFGAKLQEPLLAAKGDVQLAAQSRV
jgi:hypothetical protein